MNCPGALASLSMTLWLGACSTSRLPEPPLAQRVSPAPAAIVVAIERRTLAVHFAPGAQSPDATQIAALNVLLATGDLGRGDGLTIERPPGPLAEARAVMLSDALSREGLNVSSALSVGVPESQLRLQIEHAVARVPDCPNWTKPPGNDFDNTAHSNFGCATAMSLAAMVADPHDLIAGRPMGPAVGDAAIAAVHAYRTIKPAGPSSGGSSGTTFTVTPAGGASQ